jgi:hypothetical protein
MARRATLMPRWRDGRCLRVFGPSAWIQMFSALRYAERQWAAIRCLSLLFGCSSSLAVWRSFTPTVHKCLHEHSIHIQKKLTRARAHTHTHTKHKKKNRLTVHSGPWDSDAPESWMSTSTRKSQVRGDLISSSTPCRRNYSTSRFTTARRDLEA